jgi:hypothetical protein
VSLPSGCGFLKGRLPGLRVEAISGSATESIGLRNFNEIAAGIRKN